MKRVFIDLETTGIDEKINGILQIAGIIDIDKKL
jgi:oligoribonuclease (3'-5' exoribonuclease)